MARLFSPTLFFGFSVKTLFPEPPRLTLSSLRAPPQSLPWNGGAFSDRTGKAGGLQG